VGHHSSPIGPLAITADATAQSTVFFTPFNDDIQRQASYFLGGRVEYGPSDRRWSIGAYARNLTNTGLRHGDVRDVACGIWRTSRRLAPVCRRPYTETLARQA
jgi:hypothetical protein